MNPIDLVLGVSQSVAAALLLFRVNWLPDYVVYIIAAILGISAIWNFFGPEYR